MNALCKLRTQLGVTREHVAQALGIQVADVQTLEGTRLGLLELGDIERVVNALGCRLGVVAVHIDGQAHWLTPEAP